MSKVLVAYSGGIDSTVLLYYMVERYGRENVSAVHISYGQSEDVIGHSNIMYHLGNLRVQCRFMEIGYPGHFLYGNPVFSVVLDEDVMEEYVGGFAGAMGETSGDEYRDSLEKMQYLPGLYTLIWVYCGIVAREVGADTVAIGFENDQSASLPKPFPMDSSSGFTDQLNEIGESIFGPKPPVFVYPLIDRNKREVVALGRELGVNLSKTHSCSMYPACGRCVECLKARDALESRQ